MLRQLEARSVAEGFLKADPSALMSSDYSPSHPAKSTPVEVSIDIEVSTIKSDSPVPGEVTTSFIPFVESKGKEAMLEVETTARAASLNVNHKPHRRQSAKAQLFKLEVRQRLRHSWRIGMSNSFTKALSLINHSTLTHV